jgi:hypothetical protein
MQKHRSGEAAMAVIFAQTSGTHQTNSPVPTPIPGLSVTVPAGVKDQVLVILNVPNPYATGNNFPGGQFSISANGTALPAFAVFTYNEQTPQSTGRVPTTLAVAVELGNKPQKVQAMWQGIRGSTVIIDSPASLSALI